MIGHHVEVIRCPRQSIQSSSVKEQGAVPQFEVPQFRTIQSLLPGKPLANFVVGDAHEKAKMTTKQMKFTPAGLVREKVTYYFADVQQPEKMFLTPADDVHEKLTHFAGIQHQDGAVPVHVEMTALLPPG